MRIKQLELLKYGRFDGETVDFPSAECDFHLISGPNEAGKSTLRTAISELLFGMPHRTNLAFRHPLPDLRLGGTLEREGEETAFHRARGRTPLRTPADDKLPDDHLAPLLGAMDKGQFENMYCLDHEQLVQGGQTILDGSKEVGRVLFQSAAGVNSLGPVRLALEKRANDLWARRGKSDYATAAVALDQAKGELKNAQIRVKAWQEAKSALDKAAEEIAAVEDERASLEALRAKLERVRRLGGPLQKLRSKSAELAELGDFIELPASAADDLNDGGADLAAAEVVLAERAQALTALEASRQEIVFDQRLIAVKGDIEALDATRIAVSNHFRDLPLRQAEADRHVLDAQNAAAQLGWPSDEPGMRAKLPTSLALKTVNRMLSAQGAIQEAARSAAEALREKIEELSTLRASLDAITGTDVPEALRAAHADALTFRGAPARQRTRQAAVNSATAALDQALTQLGPWITSTDTLLGMRPPSNARAQAWLRDRQAAQSAVNSARDALQAARDERERYGLQLAQFEGANKVVTPSEVLAARGRRDATWGAVKDSSLPLAEGAPMLDDAIRLADELVDAQLGTATDAATLEAHRQVLERAQLDEQVAQRALSGADERLTSFDATWQAELAAAGLQGMSLDDLPDWLAKRDAALALHATLTQRQAEHDEELHAEVVSRDAIATALEGAGIDVSEHDDLAALAARAASFIDAADVARTRRGELSQQVEKAERALGTAQAAADSASQARQAWELEWSAALLAAGLDAAGANAAQAEAAVELANAVASSLKEADQLRRDRIDTMRTDLANFDEHATALAAQLLTTPPGVGDSSAISRDLAQQLRDALAAEQRAKDADKAIQKATVQKEEAALKVRESRARVQPLLDLAGGAASIAEAMPVVARSDLARALRVAIAEASGELLQGGDGLSIEDIEAEVAAFSPSAVVSQLEQARVDSQALAERMNGLIQQRVAADNAFSAIDGQANAAIAEAKRQEAISAMGDAAEEYFEVATAGKLLKWAIDRYRDRKQGPMLQRAGVIFKTLTLGAFDRLVVDYEKDVPTLSAQRSNGRSVEVSGLSEGTRDQLFMALRVAAIELQLQSTKPLPFVADDLFINFDDDRARAGLQVLQALSRQTQVIFLTHHRHLVPLVQQVFGAGVNIVELERYAVLSEPGA